MFGQKWIKMEKPGKKKPHLQTFHVEIIMRARLPITRISSLGSKMELLGQ